MRTRLLIVAAIVLQASVAMADKTASEVLAEVDGVVGGAVDQTMRWECVTEQGGKELGRLTFTAAVKGLFWRRIEFEAPANLKGTRVLVRSPRETYIYLPEFRKVRRVATHTKEQGFMGTAWDADQFSLASYGGIFTAESVVDKGLYWSLTLKRRPDQEFRFEQIELDVRKDMKEPFEARYYDPDGTKVITESRSDFVCGWGVCSPRASTVTDHTRGNLTTRMSLKDWKANQNLPDSMFTVRALERD